MTPKCANCGGTSFQIVEVADVWYPLHEVTIDGVLMFDASQRKVSDEGTAQRIECRTCLTELPRDAEGKLARYDWC